MFVDFEGCRKEIVSFLNKNYAIDGIFDYSYNEPTDEVYFHDYDSHCCSKISDSGLLDDLLDYISRSYDEEN